MAQTQPPDQQQISRAAEVSRRLRGLPHVNWLIYGIDRATWEHVDVRLLNLRAPITMWTPGARLVLPLTQTGTLLLHDVDSLPREDQGRLLEWLDTGRQLQVVSTTTLPLHARVQAGSFDETLYYRLNLVFVDLVRRGD